LGGEQETLETGKRRREAATRLKEVPPDKQRIIAEEITLSQSTM
jgi:hypothetical protein